MNPGEGYRLLEVGDSILETDEISDGHAWVRVGMCEVVGSPWALGYCPIRRKLPASGWVSVKERLPSEPGRVLAINHSDGKAHCTTWNGETFALNPKPYAWMAIPKPPAPPKSDAEIAWERFNEKPRPSGTFGPKEFFIAGFNAEVSK